MTLRSVHMGLVLVGLLPALSACPRGGGDDDGGEPTGSGDTADGGGDDDGSPGTGSSCMDDYLEVHPGCDPPDGYAVPDAGCYKRCTGMDYPCPEGTCRAVWIDPCVCPVGEVCCGACGAEEMLCVP